MKFAHLALALVTALSGAGPALAQAAYTAASELVADLLHSGTLTASSPWLGYDSLNTLFPTVSTQE